MPSSRQKHVYDYFVDEQGNWFCEGNQVTDRQLFRLLSRSLFQRDGRYFIRCEGEVHPVRVADAPLWIRYVHVKTDTAGNLITVETELHDGRRHSLEAETLHVAGDQALYCLTTPRRLLARFGKVAYYELARYLQMDEDSERFYLTINGRCYEIRSPGEVRISTQPNKKSNHDRS